MFRTLTVLVLSCSLAGCLPRPEPPAQTVRVDMAQFCADWRSNPAASLEQYRGKAVEFRGVVRSVSEHLVILTVDQTSSKYGERSVRVEVTDYVRPLLKNHPVGSEVTVRAFFHKMDTPPWGVAANLSP